MRYILLFAGVLIAAAAPAVASVGFITDQVHPPVIEEVSGLDAPIAQSGAIAAPRRDPATDVRVTAEFAGSADLSGWFVPVASSGVISLLALPPPPRGPPARSLRPSN